MNDRYTVRDLDLDGDRFGVAEWAGEGEPVLCIHGVSSTHKLFAWTAALVPHRRLVAPDLRGRGGSVDVGGPYGIDVHADDMRRVLDALDIDRATVVGMSLGGFIAAALTAKEPDRVSRLVLVDGGLPMRPPIPDLQRDQLPTLMASRMERTTTPYASPGAYADYFRSTMGPLLDGVDPVLDDYFAYDLDGDAPALRVRLDPDALLGDFEDVFFGATVESTLERLTVPTHLLYAEWSLGEETPGAYDAAVVDHWRGRIADFNATFVPGTDHASIVMTTTGAAALASTLA